MGLATLASALHAQPTPAGFDPFEATIPQMQAALRSGAITCQQLVQYYFARMDAFDSGGPRLNSMRARNPQALRIASAYDALPATAPRGPLFCVPIVLKDNVDTADMPTTAGSVALAGSVPPRDAFLTRQLKAAGAIIIGKANMTEFANYLTGGMPAGYSSLGGYVLNPYDARPIPRGLANADGRPALTPGGSSSGPGVIPAANLAAAAIGTETSGSILSPANANSAVGIKPTVGLISRQGVIPIAASQDTAGPITRTVTDAAILLGAMTGVDRDDPITSTQTGRALADYTPFLRADALRGARLGIPAEYWNNLTGEQRVIADRAVALMQAQGAVIVPCSIASFQQLTSFTSSVLSYEFKRDLNAYLATLGPNAPIKTLADVIAFNNLRPDVALKYGQTLAIASQARDLVVQAAQYQADRARDVQLAKTEGMDATMSANQLTAILFPGSSGANIAARAGHPTVIVPAGYLSTGSPYGISFSGSSYSEATLISLAYAYEQASKIRVAPDAAWRLPRLSLAVQPSTVVSYTTGQPGAVAPGQIVAIQGSGLGPAVAAAHSVSNGRMNTLAGGTRVLFDGAAAPIISAQANQIVAIVPYAMSGKASALMVVEAGGGRSAEMRVQLAATAPGILTTRGLGQGPAAVVNADGTVNSQANPARRGSIVTFYATGDGIPATTLGIDGRLATAPFQTPLAPVSLQINGFSVTPTYVGAAPNYAGLMQVNAQIPAAASTGAISLVMTVGDAASQAISIWVQ